MIGYVMLGTNDLQRAASFYDDLLAVMGAGRFLEGDRFIAWAVAPGQPALSVTLPYDGQAATIGNGTMVALAVETTEQVHKLYDRAMALGAADEGAPGPRMDGVYAGYFRDLDGHKLNVYCFQDLT